MAAMIRDFIAYGVFAQHSAHYRNLYPSLSKSKRNRPVSVSVPYGIDTCSTMAETFKKEITP
jgi:hypothetical protein